MAAVHALPSRRCRTTSPCSAPNRSGAMPCASNSLTDMIPGCIRGNSCGNWPCQPNASGLAGDPDPLEADIGIEARPPGKRNTSLRLLSSGEKALTAISLLFAIYQVKPSPYCILDEVDAPLDDVNIHKFTRVLSKFCDETQFIIVTHNKLTMEIADYMYGVTQEKKGISQLVSVKFN
mgnify:CR=1 FL=1